ncbi:MAG: anti-sigma factor [Nocardioidaceae bacterium]
MNDIHSQTDAYVVGALGSANAREVEAHLETCAECRAEVAELREVTAALSQSVATNPPPALRATILATIARTPQESPDTEVHEPVVHSAPAASEPAANVVPMRRSRANLGTALLAAASILAAVAFGGYALKTHQDAVDAASQSQQLTQLLSADDVVVASDRFVDSAHTGSVILSKTRQTAMFVASDLPTPPEDKVYEAWTMSNDKPTAAGTFRPSGSQSVLQLSDAALDADKVAITIEPDGGSAQPTSDVLFVVALPQA